MTLSVKSASDEFNKQKSGTETSLSAFMTEEQKKYMEVRTDAYITCT